MLNELKSRAEGKGSSVPFTVAQVRAKFKKCISECKKAALTIKTAAGVKHFQDDNYGVWFDRLFELVKTRDSCRPDLATEPLMNVPVTDCNDDVDSENQDLDKDHPSTQPFVPVKTAPKKRKRKGDNTEIPTESVNLLKTAVENGASKDVLVFLKEDIEKSREHEQITVYPRRVTAAIFLSPRAVVQSLYAPRRPTLPNWCYARICENVWWRAHRKTTPSHEHRHNY